MRGNKIAKIKKMKPRVFITASYQGGRNRGEIEKLCLLVRQSGFEDFCFIRDVENYQHIFDDPKELMKRAFDEIQKSDWLLINMTDKPTGRAIEMGIAFALNKKIVTIMKRGTIIKDTVRGVSQAIIEYENIEEIIPKLKELI
ncbi:MAG: Nucleoside 2-deoxyribosyltransferase [Candidatus Shapirobacteria bacterium GW2011_GWE1_38_10]|uniref:Nucleoside 2-deoxyribosyltransferase n=1 Tax=Candidatus Shapirobacteria bacterium GW2011_GWE1_38_10 TaxID=1618488 RepID=A0A0G0LCK2_9BACT|nr:MAG: Nucleoside 2-deoxyribosyltransferase [Candidatus Shapirobacteria bacterium GW2011_GWF2_37_20]KKQ50381.1 MAG: Nucleoside 2-deoxyribosyltransferase [Candidatus Shapirobacteria bacterium GW2011_GWE1_38_10]KKQ65205.1 MAG: Nucleoside 2-deoxyribosyltransferase [Candidatus Shapirobacteria bacterium GW2011_GWF1_38_23]